MNVGKMREVIRAFRNGASIGDVALIKFDALRPPPEEINARLGEVSGYAPELELAMPVTLTAVCFRARGLDDEAQARLLRDLVESGVALLGPARVQGHFCLRACMTNLRTDEADVDRIVEALVSAARSL